MMSTTVAERVDVRRESAVVTPQLPVSTSLSSSIVSVPVEK
jgi:hypothetical protein